MLSLCLIVKDEEEYLPSLFESVVDHVDEVVVVDTGSTDNTKQVCEEYCGDKLVWDEIEWPGNFAEARQHSFDIANGDWKMWADADDVLKGNVEGLRDLCDEMDQKGVDAAMMQYHYEYDPETETTSTLQWRERIVKEGKYEWQGYCHESLIPKDKDCNGIRVFDIEYYHMTDEERVDASLMRNVEILERALKDEKEEGQLDPRTVYNLGNAYFSVDAFERAAHCYMEYIPMSGWEAEKYLARLRCGLALANLNKFEEAKGFFFQAIEKEPLYPDAYIALGKLYYERQDHKKALHWFKNADRLETAHTLPAFNPSEQNYDVPRYIAHCLSELGRLTEAEEYFERCYEMSEDPDIKKNLEIIEETKEEVEMVDKILHDGEIFDCKEYWQTVPQKYLTYPSILKEKNKYVTKEESSGKDVAIYVGPCPDEFDNDSLNSDGIGGSEEAVIHVTRRLARRGYNVEIFGKPSHDNGKQEIGEGTLHYRHYTQFNPNNKYDYFFSWRNPQVLENNVNADNTYIWLHDTTPQENLTGKPLKQLDKILVMSNWHRSLYPDIEDDMFKVVGNGIDPEMFDEDIETDPNYCIFTSAPDRGLNCLLDIWPKIKEECPDAEMHWYYGWHTFDEVQGDNPDMMRWKDKVQEKIEEAEDFYAHGRVSQEEIAKEYQKANLWLYPTEFTETYCITAVKCQLADCLPVTTDVAALDETVQYGTKLDCDDIYTNEKMQDRFANITINYLQNPEKREEEADGMIEWANQQTWDKTTDKFEEIL